jgi:hypothetical protein
MRNKTVYRIEVPMLGFMSHAFAELPKKDILKVP